MQVPADLGFAEFVKIVGLYYLGHPVSRYLQNVINSYFCSFFMSMANKGGYLATEMA